MESILFFTTYSDSMADFWHESKHAFYTPVFNARVLYALDTDRDGLDSNSIDAWLHWCVSYNICYERQFNYNRAIFGELNCM